MGGGDVASLPARKMTLAPLAPGTNLKRVGLNYLTVGLVWA